MELQNGGGLAGPPLFHGVAVVGSVGVAFGIVLTQMERPRSLKLFSFSRGKRWSFRQRSYMASERRLPPWSWELPTWVDVLWSKGFALHCDQRWGSEYWNFPTERRSGDEYFVKHWSDCSGLVFVRLGTAKGPQDRDEIDLAAFARQLSRLKNPVVLVSQDGDCAVPEELNVETVEAILGHPQVMAWYTQNWDGTYHPKLFPLPIGLDLHSRRSAWNLCGWWGSQLLHLIAWLARPITERKGELLLDAHFQVSAFDRGQRHQLRELMEGCADCHILEGRLTRPEVWREYSRHRFVLSPAGQGLDCHRTWEALLLGAIPIVLESSLNPLYESLPVVIVKDWSEVLDPEKRQGWLQKLRPDSSKVREALSVRHWVSKMRNHL